MICHSCYRATRGILCVRCRSRMVPGPERLLGPGIRLISAFEHSGPARDLVHHLKYRGITKYADLVAGVLAPKIPPLPLVPVPRALSRKARYGVDPAREIAVRLGLITDQPVLHLISAPVHAPRRAGGDHSRPVPDLAMRGRIGTQVVLVDDVVTTGATLVSAARAIGVDKVAIAVAANASLQVFSARGTSLSRW